LVIKKKSVTTHGNMNVKLSHDVIFENALNDSAVINNVGCVASFQPSSSTSWLLRACIIDLVLVTLVALPLLSLHPHPCKTRPLFSPIQLSLSPVFPHCSSPYQLVFLFIAYQGQEDVSAVSSNRISRALFHCHNLDTCIKLTGLSHS
jgi:hypothetical protein